MNNSKIDKLLWQCGKTKMFLKQKGFEEVQIANDRIRSKLVAVIQKIWRAKFYRMIFLKKKKAASLLQVYIRCFVWRQIFKKKRAAAIKIQAVVRGWFARDFCKQLRGQKESKIKKKTKAEQLIGKSDRDLTEAERQLRDAAAVKQQEERKLADYAERINMKNKRIPKEKSPEQLDNMFAFLNQYEGDIFTIRGKSTIRTRMKLVNTDMDDIFKLGDEKTDKKKVGPNADVIGKQMRQMKANPLARILSPVMHEEPEKMSDEYALKVFAERYFEQHTKATGNTLAGTLSALTQRGKAPKPQSNFSIDEMLRYTNKVIPTAMLKFPEGENQSRNIEVAVEIFKMIMKLLEMGPKRQEEALSTARKIIETGIRIAELRDEIYVQICRQVTENPELEKQIKDWDQVQSNGWYLMALCCGCFPPSKLLSKYLNNFFLNAIQNENKKDIKAYDIIQFANYCSTTVKKIIMGGARRLPPSMAEAMAVRTQAPMLCRVYLMDGQIKATNMSATSTAADIVTDIANRIDLKDMSGWALFQIREHPW